MKAIINEILTRKTWSNKTSLQKVIIGTKENIECKVNNYIYNRIRNNSLIPVSKFDITIQNHSNKVVGGWNYSPTYR